MTETDNAAQPPTNDEVSVSSTDDARQDTSTDAPCRRRTRPPSSGPQDGARSVAIHRNRLKKAKKHVGKMQATIQRAADNGQRERVRRLRNLLLRSYDARLVATHDSNRKSRRRHRRPLENLPQVAASLNAWTGTQENVTVFRHPKGNGRYRTVMSFGLENKALQHLVNLAAKPLLATNTNRNQYMLAGRGGRNAACAAVEEAIKGECRWAIKIDIRNCYPSLRNTHDLLPFPTRIIDNTILARNFNLIAGSNMNSNPLAFTHAHLDHAHSSRNGIPQGSAASPVMVEMLLARILDELPEGVASPTYADDIIVLTKTKREAAAICLTLQGALRRHPAGSLQSKYVIQPRRVSDGFEFLGYHFKRRYGRVHVEPTSSNLRALRLKIVERYLMGDDLEDVCARIRNWARNFALWEDIDLHASFKQREAARLFRTHQ